MPPGRSLTIRIKGERSADWTVENAEILSFNDVLV